MSNVDRVVNGSIGESYFESGNWRLAIEMNLQLSSLSSFMTL